MNEDLKEQLALTIRAGRHLYSKKCHLRSALLKNSSTLRKVHRYAYQILKLMYFDRVSLKTIALKTGLTQSRVRQIEEKAYQVLEIPCRMKRVATLQDLIVDAAKELSHEEKEQLIIKLTNETHL